MYCTVVLLAHTFISAFAPSSFACATYSTLQSTFVLLFRESSHSCIRSKCPDTSTVHFLHTLRFYHIAHLPPEWFSHSLTVVHLTSHLTTTLSLLHPTDDHRPLNPSILESLLRLMEFRKHSLSTVSLLVASVPYVPLSKNAVPTRQVN